MRVRSAGLTELRRPRLLDNGRHDLSQFESTDPGLGDWLRRYAGQNRRRNTAAVWVIPTSDDVVVAYASLSMSSVERGHAPTELSKSSPDPIPVLLVGRLAVDHRYSGHGIGSALVAHLLATAIDLNERAACRAVVVTAIDETARRWWERLGFVRFDETDPWNYDLYLLTADIVATVASITER